MKVLVTGATGFVGNKVVKALHEIGHQSVVLTRNIQKAQVRLPYSCQIHFWDPEKNIFPEQSLEGVQAVIHLAGENIAEGRWSADKKEKIKNSRLLSTQALVQAIKKTRVKPEVLVSASAIGIYGDRKDEVLTEDSAKDCGWLADVCNSWETEVSKAQEIGIRTVMLRIGVVLGHDGGAMSKILTPFRMALGGNLGNGKQWMSWIHLEDVAAMFVHAIENATLMGPYNAVSPHPVTNEEFTRILAKVLNQPTFFPVPKFALKLALGEMSQILLDSQKVSADHILTTGFMFRYPTLERALTEICSHAYHELEMEQWIPQPPDQAFQFFKKCENLECLTPDFLNFKIINKSTDAVRRGTTMNYKLRLHGIPFNWQSKITEWEPNQHFSDIQTKGPYDYWHHRHDFEAKDGGTLLKDHVIYRVPFGIFGDLLTHGLVKKDLENIFSFRRSRINKLLA